MNEKNLVNPVIRALECGICMLPKPLAVLQCGHAYCPSCLASTYSFGPQEGRRRKLICPSCKNATKWGYRESKYYPDAASTALSSYLVGPTQCTEDLGNHAFLPRDVHCQTCNVDICGVCYTEKHSTHKVNCRNY